MSIAGSGTPSHRRRPTALSAESFPLLLELFITKGFKNWKNAKGKEAEVVRSAGRAGVLSLCVGVMNNPDHVPSCVDVPGPHQASAVVTRALMYADLPAVGPLLQLPDLLGVHAPKR